MSDLLAIVDPAAATDEALIAEILRRHPDRVTLLVEDADADWADEDSARESVLADRLTQLRAAIEATSGAAVVGLVASRDQLLGWRFDRIIGARQHLPAT